jgi:hypothetical protein
LGYYVTLQAVPPAAPIAEVANSVQPPAPQQLPSSRRRRGRPCKCAERGIPCKHGRFSTTTYDANNLPLSPQQQVQPYEQSAIKANYFS